MRKYEPRRIAGDPVAFKTVSDRRALIGRKIGWHSRGWITPRYGVLQKVDGKNLLVDNNWEWATDMLNVHVLEDSE